MAAAALAEDTVANMVAVGSKAVVVSSPQVGLVGGAAERAAAGTEVAAVRAEAATEAAVMAAEGGGEAGVEAEMEAGATSPSTAS